MAETKNQFDDLFDDVGHIGRFQILAAALLYLGAAFGADSILQNFIGGSAVEHWCLIPELGNLTYVQQRYVAIPRDSDGEYETCKKYDLDYASFTEEELLNWDRSSRVDNDTATAECQEWVFKRDVFEETLRSTFDLTCDRAWLVPMPASIYFFGLLFGAYITGELGDRLGRKPVIYSCALIKMLFGIAGAFSPTMWFYLLTMFVVGFVSAGVYMSGYILLSEIVGPKYRSIMGIGYQMSFSLAFVLYSGMAYALRDWRYLSLAVYVIWIPYFIGIWIVPESPRWQIKKHKLEEAEKTLAHMAKVNKRPVQENLTEMVKDIHEEEQRIFAERSSQKSCLDLYRSPRLRLWSIAINYHWFTVSLMYYAMSLSAAILVGSVFVNVTILGLVEIPANILAIIGCDWALLGRRYTSSWSLTISGISCFIMIPLILYDEEIAISAMSFTGKAFVTVAFSAIYVFSSEVFPTEIRNAGMGAASLCARVGGILAPWLGAPLADVWGPLPVIVFGIIGTTAGLFLLVVPETLGSPMFQTLEEAENLGRKSVKAPEAPEKTGSPIMAYVHCADNLAFVPEEEIPNHTTNKNIMPTFIDSTYL